MMIERIRTAVPVAYRAPFHRSHGHGDTSGQTAVETEVAVVDVSPDGRQSRDQPKKQEEEGSGREGAHPETEEKERHVNVVV